MPDQFKPRTTYVGERLQATPWGDRQTIFDLLDLERLCLRRWGNGFDLLQLNWLARARPLEALIIRAEIKSGRRLTDAEAQAALDDEDRQRRERAAAEYQREAQERQQQERVEYEAWIRAGGQP
jgi:hypothetical protein